MLHSPHLLSHFSHSLPFHHHHHHQPLLHFSPLSTPLHFTPPPPLHATSQLEQTLTIAETGAEAEAGAGAGAGAEGPIELLPSSTRVFAVDDNPSPLQVATSVLLTGAISVFLFRSLRRRARRAKELRVRSTGVKASKDLRAEAVDSLRAIGVAPVEAGKPPSPVQALLGGIAAGAIALILYKFTTTIEAALSRQAISDNFSVRQITITIRTIVNGLCYLATFVFGINSIGLVLYSIQLAFNSFMDSPDSISMAEKEDGKLKETTEPTKNTADVRESSDDS